MSSEDEGRGSEGEEDFASMLEASYEAESYQEGQTVEGRVVSVGREVAFIDVGGKGEATIDLEELVDPDGKIDVRVGDIVQGVVVSTSGGVKLSHRLARRAASRQQLAQAFRAGLPVEGRVEKSIKGGFEVRVGGQRGFCPISQIDSTFTQDPSVHEGRVYTFRITQLGEEGRDVVLSRRALLEEEERARAAEVRRQIVPGAVLAGRVVSVRDYGAFVDLGGGIQGLLHVSEMGWSRTANPAGVVSPGDEITVKVLRLDEAKGTISLGLKQLTADPWTTAADTYEVGQRLEGTVTRVAEFGAFIELEPGIEALAHASTFPPTGKRDAWKTLLEPRSTVAVEILSFDAERKRIGVAVLDRGLTAGAAERVEIVPGARVTAKVERHESYGVFLFLAPGRTGLMPTAETGLERGADLVRAFPAGSEIEVLVLDVDRESSRIRLSRRALIEEQERREAREFAERQDRSTAGGFGSLADKLRDAIDRGPKS